MDSAPETALAFSAVAPWERPGFAAHAIQYPEFPTPNIASQRPALRIVPTIIDFAGRCGLVATDVRLRAFGRQHSSGFGRVRHESAAPPTPVKACDVTSP